MNSGIDAASTSNVLCPWPTSSSANRKPSGSIRAQHLPESLDVEHGVAFGDLDDRLLRTAPGPPQEQQHLVDPVDGIEQSGNRDVDEDDSAVGKVSGAFDRRAPADPVEVPIDAEAVRRREDRLDTGFGRRTSGSRERLVAGDRASGQVHDRLIDGHNRAVGE